MNTINQNIFDGKWDAMVHCANLYHTMGGGIARVIAEKFPQVLEADKQTEKSCESKLGHFSHANTPLGEVFNLYGQVGIGNDGDPLHRNVRYDHIYDGLTRICDYLYFKNPDKIVTVAIPWGMGCGLAGGSWPIVEAIIDSIEKRYKYVNFVIYKL